MSFEPYSVKVSTWGKVTDTTWQDRTVWTEKSQKSCILPYIYFTFLSLSLSKKSETKICTRVTSETWSRFHLPIDLCMGLTTVTRLRTARRWSTAIYWHFKSSYIDACFTKIWELHKRSQDFDWSALFFPEKVDLVLVVAIKTQARPVQMPHRMASTR